MHFLSGSAEFLQTALLSALAIIIVLLGLNVIFGLILLRKKGADFAALGPRFDSMDKGVERCERSVRDEIAKNREEATLVARQGREETGNVLKSFGDSLQTSMTNIAGLQKAQLDVFASQLSILTQTNEKKLDSMRGTIEQLTQSSENRLEALRNVIDGKLKQIQEDNSRRLEQMRATVDEKLQGTLEKRLGESFKQVSERLEQVHKGLGEMQALAIGVGDLKRVLTNVKTRGMWGEIQLETLLEQILTPEQYERNVQTKENSGEMVEFAVRLPGRGEKDGPEVVWLPIDAKFPIEDYQRLVDAQENGDPGAAEQAAKMLSATIKNCAKTICDKYLNPPATTDFGIMFLPTEGLYAEVIRRTWLVESLQRECRVIVAGPTTLAALLNSLQMGFRTLAIQKRSSEVWKLLGAVKAEFGKFGTTLEGVKKKLDQAANTMDDAAKRSRAIERKLRNVEELPSEEAGGLLVSNDSEPEPEDADS
jgi:DNA recombination protein RmuC